MKQQATEIRLFFFSQQFADGLRTTLAVLLPALLASYMNRFEVGLTISLGALGVSIVDTPGPIIHRKNAMLLCLFFIVVVAFITGFARLNMYTIGLEILLFSFFFSMFSVYGLRASLVGSAALLVMVLTMDQPVESAEVLFHGILIFCGGLWYMLISLLAYQVRPFRTAQRTLGESIRELATFLRIKADFYDVNKELDESYRKLLAQQVVVSEKQDQLRELLFKTRTIVKDTSHQGRKLLLTFIHTVDLFEDMTATLYDYPSLRNRYKENSILDSVADLARQMANELDAIGITIHTNTSYKRELDFDQAFVHLKKVIDNNASNESTKGNFVLRKLLVNIRRMMVHIEDIRRYFDEQPASSIQQYQPELQKFVSHQSLDPKILWNNLNFSSTAFKHSLRVAIACGVGFVIAKAISLGHHSYWIIMTIIFMVKPSYGLTKERNWQRILGTLIGVVPAMLFLLFIKNKQTLFAIMVLMMLGTYSLQRVKYFLSIIFMTPFILILFHFLGIGFMGIIKERIIDTLIGCVIAFSAGYLLFPEWESKQLNTYLLNMLQANSDYLSKIVQYIYGKPFTITEYKLARKEVYVHSANLSSAFQRMLSEPKSKQKNAQVVHQFVVLNHTLFSNIAALASTITAHAQKIYPESVKQSAHKALNCLNSQLKKLDP
ncbi:MAG: FUSC family protein, partial [Flavisolibacter sp.]|nr:FUSC family protein [Flavisolibacter sp.]